MWINKGEKREDVEEKDIKVKQSGEMGYEKKKKKEIKTVYGYWEKKRRSRGGKWI